MSFQAYIDNIRLKTGKSVGGFKKLAAQKGFMQDGKVKPAVKATQITDWLKQEFQLGNGHGNLCSTKGEDRMSVFRIKIASNNQTYQLIPSYIHKKYYENCNHYRS